MVQHTSQMQNTLSPAQVEEIRRMRNDIRALQAKLQTLEAPFEDIGGWLVRTPSRGDGSTDGGIRPVYGGNPGLANCKIVRRWEQSKRIEDEGLDAGTLEVVNHTRRPIPADTDIVIRRDPWGDLYATTGFITGAFFRTPDPFGLPAAPSSTLCGRVGCEMLQLLDDGSIVPYDPELIFVVHNPCPIAIDADTIIQAKYVSNRWVADVECCAA